MMDIPIYSLLLLAIHQLFCTQSCSSQTFDQVYTRVVFTPYVKQIIKGTSVYPPWNEYTKKEIQVMLEIISEKFSKALTWFVGSNDGPYVRNFTYYNDSYAYAHTAEISADINRKRGNKSLTILQGLWLFETSQIETEVQLAIECVEKANKIYPGTVEGILLSNYDIDYEFKQTELALKYLTILRKLSLGDLKLGSWMYCNGIFTNRKGESPQERHAQLLHSILQNSDFVVCRTDSHPHSTINVGSVDSFDSITNKLLELRTKLQEHNANLEVIGLLKWTSSDIQKLDNEKGHKLYWENVGHWAKQNNFPILFDEAFDNPWRGDDGWWRLSDNSKSDLREGYIEKITELSFTKTTAMKTVLVVSIVVGLSLLLLLLTVTVFLFKLKKKSRQISNEDVREFREGIKDETIEQQDPNNDEIPGIKLPYDISWEININHLKIDTSTILGKGQFGRVYKTIIKRNGKEAEHVALKVSKDGCSRSTLKDLLTEIKVMAYISGHPNVVALKGVCTAELLNGVVYIAMELCSLGSLGNYLRNQQKISKLNISDENASKEVVSVNTICHKTRDIVTLQEMLKWSYEIACGMDYLGSKNIVHADLATRNVLLTGEKNAKIADFGLSKRMYNYATYVKSKKGPLPWRWMAIESLKWGEFSAKCDVWSYGITLWEIFSLGELPFSGLSWTPNFVKMLIDGMRLECPDYATPEIYELLINCWQKKQDNRPDFSEICQTIRDIIAKNKEKLFVIC